MDTPAHEQNWIEALIETQTRLRSMTTDCVLWEVKVANDQINHGLGLMPIQLVALYQREIETRLGPSLQLLHPDIAGP